jgi:hypothetical protein
MTTADDLLPRLPDVPTEPATTGPDRATVDRATVDRASSIFHADSTITWEQALDLAAEQLAYERDQQAEARARSQSIVDSFHQMTACRICGAQANGADGYCADCRCAAYVKRGLTKLSERIGGHSIDERIAADWDRQATP